LVATCRLPDGPDLGTRDWRLNGNNGSVSPGGATPWVGTYLPFLKEPLSDRF